MCYTTFSNLDSSALLPWLGSFCVYILRMKHLHFIYQFYRYELDFCVWFHDTKTRDHFDYLLFRSLSLLWCCMKPSYSVLQSVWIGGQTVQRWKLWAVVRTIRMLPATTALWHVPTVQQQRLLVRAQPQNPLFGLPSPALCYFSLPPRRSFDSKPHNSIVPWADLFKTFVSDGLLGRMGLPYRRA